MGASTKFQLRFKNRDLEQRSLGKETAATAKSA